MSGWLEIEMTYRKNYADLLSNAEKERYARQVESGGHRLPSTSPLQAISKPISHVIAAVAQIRKSPRPA